MTTHSTDGPNPIDIRVGHRIRMRRRDLKITQEMLAKKLGVSFQQCQKYERGTNRVSASKLFEISRALQVGVEYFFAGIEPETGETPDDIPALLGTLPELRLLTDFRRDQVIAVRNVITAIAHSNAVAGAIEIAAGRP